MKVLCNCERAQYDDDQFSSCFECFEERRDEYASCIWCGKWHSPRYSTCYTCRVVHHREEAGQALKLAILMRDDFQCQRPGCGSREQPQIDHIQPCYEGGTADVWNLQVLCHACNKAKGATWFYGSSHWQRRVDLMHRYFTFWWDWIDDEERARLVEDAADPLYEGFFQMRARFRKWRGELVDTPGDHDSHTLAARLRIDHDTLEPLGEVA